MIEVKSSSGTLSTDSEGLSVVASSRKLAPGFFLLFTRSPGLKNLFAKNALDTQT
jgi:hypothetical protein